MSTSVRPACSLARKIFALRWMASSQHGSKPLLLPPPLLLLLLRRRLRQLPHLNPRQHLRPRQQPHPRRHLQHLGTTRLPD